MNVYLESSAALRDLLDGESAAAVRKAVREAEQVVVSRLTLAEVARVFARLRALDPTAAAGAVEREAAFAADSELWAILPIDEEILSRCGRPFPVEPVRMLDAVHLATVEKLSSALPDVVVLSTDARVRENARALGFAIVPEPA